MGIATAFTLEDQLKLQRERVQRGEFTPLGRLVKVILEPARDAPLPPREQTRVVGVSMDWQRLGPTLGLSLDQQDLLIISPVPPLPRIPDVTWKAPPFPQVRDPNWKSTGPAPLIVDPSYKAPDAPLIEQRYENFTNARVKNSTFLVFSPVAQILFRMLSAPAFRMIKSSAGFDGTQLTLLIDPTTGQGHFTGGRFIIV